MARSLINFQQNMILQSEALNDAAWTRSNFVVTDNQIANPIDGTVNAALISDTADASPIAHLLKTTVDIVFELGQRYTFSFYAKSATANSFLFLIPNGNSPRGIFDLTNGTSSIISTTFRVNDSQTLMIPLSNGWYHCFMQFPASSASSPPEIFLQTTNVNSSTYTGTGSPMCYLWGIQMYVGRPGANYVKTTSSAIGGANPPKIRSFKAVNYSIPSQEFDNASWTKSNLTVTPNQVANPITGDVDADLFSDAVSGSVTHSLSASAPSTTILAAYNTNEKITVSVFVKRITNDYIFLRVNNGAGVCFYNINTGTLGNVAAGYNAAIVSYGNGWYRCLWSGPRAVGLPQLGSSTANGGVNYAGTGQDQFYLWGWQVYMLGNWAGDYVRIAPSTVTNPNYNFSNSIPLLTPTNFQNLCPASEDFSNAAWVKTNCTITTNATTGPVVNGTALNADALVDNATNGLHSIALNSVGNTTLPVVATFSCYLKAANQSWVKLNLSGGLAGNFNLSNGTIGTLTSCTATVTSMGSDWYRCAITATETSVLAFSVVITAMTSDSGSTYAGSSTAAIYMSGAQIVTANWAGDYCKATTTSITRAAPHNVFLTENRLLQSEDFANASWTLSNATITSNATTGPVVNGVTLNADAFVDNSSNVGHSIQQSITGSSSAGMPINSMVAVSCFFKTGTQPYARIRWNNLGAYFNVSNGTIGTIDSGRSAYITSYGNGWYRCTVTGLHTGSSSLTPVISSHSADNTLTYAGGTNQAIYMSGAQCVVSNWAGDYVKTTTIPLLGMTRNIIALT